MDLSEPQTTLVAERLDLVRAAYTQSGRIPTRQEARDLVLAYTQGESLRAHMLAVEVSMAAYATKFNADETLFRVVGLLHDFDYEQYQEVTSHPFVGCCHLAEQGVATEVIEAILGHATYAEVARESQVAKTLFAVDELTGFLSAIAYVRPTGLDGMKWKSFRKKFKTASFAAAVNRSEVEQGVRELGVDFTEHVLFLADALQTAFPQFPIVPDASSVVKAARFVGLGADV